MNIYTKNGDRGTTDLIRSHNVAKSDDRISLVGTIDELTSHIGLCKSMISDRDTVRFLEKIQSTLITVMDGVADPYNNEYRLKEDKTELLEEEIDRLESLFERPEMSVLPGKTRLSAEIDVARTVARRAERALSLVSIRFGADSGAKKYMNRLADYLYILARYTGACEGGDTGRTEAAAPIQAGIKKPAEGEKSAEALVQEVLRRMGVQTRITLDTAKKLIGEIEKEAERQGKKAVIAVCSPDGNPVAVHVMDGAFLVSFDVAIKKAYTSVAVKMSTMELSRLAQPGGTFYGLDKMEGGKIVIFGGGVPLMSGDTVIGGLGVSGGTGEEDHALAEYGQKVLAEMLNS